MKLLRLIYGPNLLAAIRCRQQEDGCTVRQAIARLLRLQRRYGQFR